MVVAFRIFRASCVDVSYDDLVVVVATKAVVAEGKGGNTKQAIPNTLANSDNTHCTKCVPP